MGLDRVGLWRRREAGHCKGRGQLDLTHGCTELGRDEEKKEACAVGCVTASALCKMAFLCRHCLLVGHSNHTVFRLGVARLAS